MKNSTVIVSTLRALIAGLEAKTATTDDVKSAAVAVLDLISPLEPYGTALFEALARLTVSVCVEMVIFRKTTSSQEVLLRKRGANEVYPNQWHVVGSSFRPGDSVAETIARAIKECGDVNLPTPTFRGYYNNLNEERGHYVHLLYVIDATTDVEIPTKPGEIEWFSLEALPQDLIENHREIVLPVTLGHYDSQNLEIFVR